MKAWSGIALAALLAAAGCVVHTRGLGEGEGDGDGDLDGDADADEDGDAPDGPPASCGNGRQDGLETDVDCGGGCRPCAAGQGCWAGSDCESLVCVEEVCQAATCADGLQNQGEAEVDCGGPCPPCPHGRPCSPLGGECEPYGVCLSGRCDVYGQGGEGDLVVAGAERVESLAAASASGALGDRQIVVSTTEGFEAGQRVVVHQTTGGSAGSWELASVDEVQDGVLVLAGPLRHEYVTAGRDRAQVLAFRQYRSITVQNGAVLTGSAWQGDTGGLLVLVASESVVVEDGGAVRMSGRGYRGGRAGTFITEAGAQGEGWPGTGIGAAAAPAVQSWKPNGSGGGGGQHRVDPFACEGAAGGGGGGGHAALASAGAIPHWCHASGAPGRAAGGDPASILLFGGGGGAGGADENALGGRGAAGGGILLVLAPEVRIDGRIDVDGRDGAPGASSIAGCGAGGGGGGAGGTALLVGGYVDLGSGNVTARGGTGGDDAECGPPGGAGAQGWVFVPLGVVTGDSQPAVTQSALCGAAGSCPAVAATSCRAVDAARGDGPEWIDPDGQGALLAYCDMTSDGGGYGLLRVDDPALADVQMVYEFVCAQRGMEVVVPRTKSHALAIQVWNGGVIPNLVNVFPAYDGAAGLGNWVGRCRGEQCTYWLSGTNDADCGEGEEPSGDNDVNHRLYRFGDACAPGNDYGRWNDGYDDVAIPGWVICSPNDR
jgi:hypothetical protein